MEIRDLKSELERYRAAEKEGRLKSCEWFETDQDANLWECGNCHEEWTFIEGNPVENDMQFCPKCGAKVDVVNALECTRHDEDEECGYKVIRLRDRDMPTRRKRPRAKRGRERMIDCAHYELLCETKVHYHTDEYGELIGEEWYQEPIGERCHKYKMDGGFDCDVCDGYEKEYRNEKNR